ncbi:hypothetical protein ACEPAG_7867 [Sanghuangporus baumii]
MFHPGTEDADKVALVDFRSGKKFKCLDVHLVPGPSLLWLGAYGPPSRSRVGSELLTLDPDAVASASPFFFQVAPLLSALVIHHSPPPVFRRQRRLMRSPRNLYRLSRIRSARSPPLLGDTSVCLSSIHV